MQSDYHIEELVFQNEHLVVYRALHRGEVPVALVRLRYDEWLLQGLIGPAFTHALDELMGLSHPCLRPVLDGGMDPIDGQPWIAARWWEGTPLPERLRNSDLSAEEYERIKTNGESLIEGLRQLAGVVSFTPSSVVMCGEGERAIDTFSIDYHTWFHAFARGVHPAVESATHQKFTNLLLYLKRQTAPAPPPQLTPTPAPAPPSSPSALPTAAAPLASSSKSSFPVKALSFILILLGGIGFLSWKLFSKPAPPEVADVPTLATVAENAPEKIATPVPSPLTDYFTVADEQLIRDEHLGEQLQVVRATVVALTSSSSGKTNYLQFKDSGPEFAVSIRKNEADDTLTGEYLASLVGKTIEVTAKTQREGNGRLLLVVTRGLQITLIQ